MIRLFLNFIRTRLALKNHIAKLKIPVTEYPNKNDSEDTKTNKTSATPNVMPKTLPNDEISGVNSLNSKQREIFNVVRT